MPGIALPPFARTALLLDLDGTLLDIAPTPDAVVVPPHLVADLRALRGWLGGALAIITGRPVEQVDALLGDAPSPANMAARSAMRPASRSAAQPCPRRLPAGPPLPRPSPPPIPAPCWSPRHAASCCITARHPNTAPHCAPR
jgi:hypothetical protein